MLTQRGTWNILSTTTVYCHPQIIWFSVTHICCLYIANNTFALIKFQTKIMTSNNLGKSIHGDLEIKTKFHCFFFHLYPLTHVMVGIIVLSTFHESKMWALERFEKFFKVMGVITQKRRNLKLKLRQASIPELITTVFAAPPQECHRSQAWRIKPLSMLNISDSNKKLQVSQIRVLPDTKPCPGGSYIISFGWCTADVQWRPCA